MIDGGAKSLADKTYNGLREDIMAGRIAPGSKLKLETLTGEYGVGMSPLREALGRLVGDLLVTSESQRGFWVSPLSLEELDDISRVRALIEVEAVRLAIQNGDQGWEDALSEAFKKLADAEQDLPRSGEELPADVIERWEVCNRDFHSALVSASNSPLLNRFRGILYQQSERYRRISLERSRTWRDVHEEHLAIFEAAISRNTLKACRMTELHVSRTADAVRAALADLSKD